MKKSILDGEVNWTLIERNTSGDTFDESLVETYKKQSSEPAQIKFNKKDLNKHSTIAEYVEIIQKEIASKTLNEQDKLILSQYISTILQKLNMQSVEASKNKVTITNELLKNINKNLDSSEQEINSLLEIDKLALNKNPEHIARFNVDNLNLEKAVEVVLEEGLLEGINWEEQGKDTLYISFDGSSMGISLTYNQLHSIIQDSGTVTLSFTYIDDNVTISFENEDGKVEKLSAPIQVVMPSKSESSMVYFNEELWGGKYNKEMNSLFFDTKTAGTYTLKKSEEKVSDIADLTKEQQEAINFLITHGLFEIENEQFEPTKTISRNEFAKSVSRMFYLLDPDAVTSFVDVDKASPYYSYIASAEANSIVSGYEDSTFKGDSLVPISQVLSASTLVNKKGYAYPTNSEEYLGFIDIEKISEEAKGEVALNVREGLIEEGELLEPERQITRVESAEILYNLYMLLYDESPYLVKADVEIAKPFYIEYKWVIVGIASCLIIIVGVIFWKRRKLNSLT